MMNKTLSKPMNRGILLGALVAGSLPAGARANDRLFTYSHEPETMPQDAMEYEQWVTLRAGRTGDVGKENFNRWDLRSELEYDVTGWYPAGLYLNLKRESYRDPTAPADGKPGCKRWHARRG